MEIIVGLRSPTSKGCKKPAEVSVALATTLNQFGSLSTESSQDSEQQDDQASRDENAWTERSALESTTRVATESEREA